MTTPLQTNRNDENDSSDSYLAARKSILGAADKAAAQASHRDMKAAAEHRSRRAEADRRHGAARVEAMNGHDRYGQ